MPDILAGLRTRTVRNRAYVRSWGSEVAADVPLTRTNRSLTMHTDMIWHMALERQAGFRAEARRNSLRRIYRSRHDVAAAPDGTIRKTGYPAAIEVS